MKKIYNFLMLVFILLGAQGVMAQCNADFYNYTNGQGTFTFYDSAGSTYTTDNWTFGDGNTGNATRGQISHTYARTGTYTVCRIIWDSANSCRDTFCVTITYKSTCRAGFSYRSSGTQVTFTNASSSNIVYWTWKFGDGTTSSATNPTHKYAPGKTYTVCLIVKDSLSTCLDSMCRTVYIPKACNASFSASGSAGTYRFSDSSGNSYTQNYWTFGDGTSDSTTSGNTTHTYSNAGGYTVCRVVWDSANNCRDTFCVNIMYCGLKAKFGISRSGDTISFHDSSTNAVYYSWKFGDGQTSTSQNPVHVYQSGRTYTACLTVYDSSRRCYKSYCYTIVTSGSGGCNASFYTRQTGNSVDFNATNSTGSGLVYTWNFGNGSTGSGKQVSHTYTVPPGYTVYTYQACLTIYDSSSSCSDSSCRTITVRRDSCSASFTSASSGLAGYFYNRSSNTTSTSYAWTFGDGGTSTATNPQHTYSARGTYNVCLTVSDSALKCSITFCDSITVDTIRTSRCNADFSMTVRDSIVSITNSSTGSNNFYWYTSTGDSSTAKNPTFVFPTPGSYYICLYAYDSSGNFCDSVCKSVTIAKSCKAYFRVAIDTTKKFRLYLINGSSNKSSHSYKWTFGDGGTSTARNPTHKYKSFGRYYVCLTVTDSKTNCSDTYCDSLGLDSNGRLLKADGFELVVIEDNLSVRNAPKVSYAMYPNPVSDELKIELSGTYSKGAYVSIYSLDGRLIKEQSLELNGVATMDMSEQKNGLYVVRIFDGNNYAQTKLVKMAK